MHGLCGVWNLDARIYFDTTIKLCKQTHSSGKRAKDQLYGVYTSIKAWTILSKKFGDKYFLDTIMITWKTCLAYHII